MKPPEPAPLIQKNPFCKVPRTLSFDPKHLDAISGWVEDTKKVRPFPICHPGEVVGEMVENAQETGWLPTALRKLKTKKKP